MREVIGLRQLRAMPAEHAAALLVAYLSDLEGDQDGDILDLWLADDEANPVVWARMTEALVPFNAPDEDDLFGDLRASALAAGPPARGNRVWFAAAAAVALIFAGITAWTSGGHFPLGNAPQTAGASPQGKDRGESIQVARAGKGEIRLVPLPDGSVVTLDTQSAVEIAYSGTGRDLKLIAGRAQFDVRHDKAKPFVVHASGYDVVAVGTRFDVRLTDKGAAVLLIEGRLRIADTSDAASAFILDAGQEAILAKGARPRLLQINQDRIDDWPEGLLTFSDQPLSEVVAELNRYSTDRLVIKDARVASLTVTGTFRPGDLGRFDRTISAIYPVDVVRLNQNEREIRWTGAQ